MVERVNGTQMVEAQQEVMLRVSILNLNPGFKVVFCTDKGDYVGSLTADAQSNEGFKLMAAHFPNIVQQMTGSVQVVGASALPPLRTQ